MSDVTYTIGKPVLDVLDERHRQDAKWGEQNHPDDEPNRYWDNWGQDMEFLARGSLRSYGASWSAILVEEVGEALSQTGGGGDLAALRAELIQVAAVAVAWVEALDRRAGP